MTVTQENGVADTPGRSFRLGSTRVWLGLFAGFAGLVVLLAVEMTSIPAGRAPAVRYTPPVRSGDGAVAVTPAVTFIVHPTVEGLQAAFDSAAYDLEETRRKRTPVPRLRLVMLPRDLPDMTDIAERKTVFLSLTLPLILEANARIVVERRRLRHAIERRAAGHKLPQDLKDWLAGLAKRYKGSADRLDALLQRVDTVPPSLVLAQAAAESGWGTSRFAVEGNAIFGQWTTAGGRGLVPLERPDGATYKIRSFDRLIDSVNAYLLNLNTHRSYRGFRKMRAAMRQAGKPLDGAKLAGGLSRYSETGEEYVGLLRGIIRKNRLSPLDRATLGDTLIELARL
ncbi:MAG: glucosaminidase domain-containing protein [Alphaproteobacteria bacterium]|nr:glucosaminidase domain-containing protein [Alphaproteobacteria bacterium]